MNEYKENIAGKLARIFINHPLTSVLVFIIIALGYISLTLSPREENPQIKVAGASIMVQLPGASAEEVQKVIIDPLERKIREIKGVDHIYSISKDSLGIVQVQFLIGEDKNESNTKLYNQIMRNMDILPLGASIPIIKTMDIDTDIPILNIAFYTKNQNDSQIELYKKINMIAKDINKISNIALVDLKGEKKEQYNILLDVYKLDSYHISFSQVRNRIQDLVLKLPNIKADTLNNELISFSIKSSISGIKDLNNLIINNESNNPIYLKDIANIKKSYDIQNKKEVYLYTRNDNSFSPLLQQISMSISKLKGANTVTIANDVFRYLENKKDYLDKNGIKYEITRNDAYTANTAVNSLVINLFISIIIIFILLIFTLGKKEAFIVSLMVPMILSLTLFIGYITGETINRITLFALLVALGMLVDAAIIVIENIHRHKKLHKNKSIEKISIEATNEIGNPTNIATIAIILTFIPMFFVEGMMGQFMRPLPIFVPISLIMSLFVAYTFTPYLIKKIIGENNAK